VESSHENDKQRHHRGDEVGIGYLPGASMMCGMTGLLFDYDDRGKLLVIVHGVSSSRGCCGAAGCAALAVLLHLSEVGRHSMECYAAQLPQPEWVGKPLMKAE